MILLISNLVQSDYFSKIINHYCLALAVASQAKLPWWLLTKSSNTIFGDSGNFLPD